MRYTVQRNRKSLGEFTNVISPVSQKEVLNSTLKSSASLYGNTQELFLERYKQLYFKHYINKDNIRTYNYR
jgi:hypothetical protein